MKTNYYKKNTREHVLLDCALINGAPNRKQWFSESVSWDCLEILHSRCFFVFFNNRDKIQAKYKKHVMSKLGLLSPSSEAEGLRSRTSSQKGLSNKSPCSSLIQLLWGPL